MAKQQQNYLNHPWDRAAATALTRLSGVSGEQEPLDPGVNFFVLALEALGAKPRFSCEGHPAGFYVSFEAPYELALEIQRAGYFSVEIERGQNFWSIRKRGAEYWERAYPEESKVQTLRLAAEAWVAAFGDRLAGLECLKSV